MQNPDSRLDFPALRIESLELELQGSSLEDKAEPILNKTPWRCCVTLLCCDVLIAAMAVLITLGHVPSRYTV